MNEYARGELAGSLSGDKLRTCLSTKISDSFALSTYIVEAL